MESKTFPEEILVDLFTTRPSNNNNNNNNNNIQLQTNEHNLTVHNHIKKCMHLY